MEDSVYTYIHTYTNEQGNVVRDGRGKGIFVHEKGRGLFEGNDVAGNSGTGVTIASEGDPVMRKNKVCVWNSGLSDMLFEAYLLRFQTCA
jgi:hypothetical protein